MSTDRNKRSAISKATRFEVFKRDSFRCQYCGAEAPQVLLHIDHIKPVSKGGTNELPNLITACQSCNLGKSNIPLDEHSAVCKARAQMEELQERREQLELMMQWQESLQDIQQDAVNRLALYWERIAPGWSVNEHGEQCIKKWLIKYSAGDICKAMDVAATYLEFDINKKVTGESWEVAFNKITGICRVNRMSEADPDIKDLLYIRGILRNRIDGFYDDAKALKYLKNARSWDISVDELSALARQVDCWRDYEAAIGEAIHNRRIELGECED